MTDSRTRTSPPLRRLSPAAKLGSSSTDLDARLKTLLTMKFVAAKGSTEFRRSLQAHKELVKDHTREYHAPWCAAWGFTAWILFISHRRH